ncbi:hypothetical protein BMG05_19845 [Mycobacterium malmoense]|nr:hypothetical protein BMG05_19845 [Mycobacterium malmoense]
MFVDGDDHHGQISITTGTSSEAGELANLTFGQPFTTAPLVTLVQFGGAWLNASAAPTTTGIAVSVAETPAAATTYAFAYVTNPTPNVFPFTLTGRPFFTPRDLAYRLQIDPAAINLGTACLLAQLASDAVRQDLWLSVDYVENDTVTLYGDYSGMLVLPQRPVTAVTSVVLAGETLTQSQPGATSTSTPMFDWRPDGRLLRIVYGGQVFASQLTWLWPNGVPVTVTYTHGYQVVPSCFKSVALELAAGVYNNPEIHSNERVGWVEWATKNVDLNLNDQQRASLDYYRKQIV